MFLKKNLKKVFSETQKPFSTSFAKTITLKTAPSLFPNRDCKDKNNF